MLSLSVCLSLCLLSSKDTSHWIRTHLVEHDFLNLITSSETSVYMSGSHSWVLGVRTSTHLLKGDTIQPTNCGLFSTKASTLQCCASFFPKPSHSSDGIIQGSMGCSSKRKQLRKDLIVSLWNWTAPRNLRSYSHYKVLPWSFLRQRFHKVFSFTLGNHPVHEHSRQALGTKA